MLKDIRAGILWSRAIGKLHAGDGRAAVDLIERMERLRELKPYHIVMLAHAEIADGHDDRAAIYLGNALSMMTGNESANARYLKLHAQAILNLMEGNAYGELAREAATIACTPRLRRWFPLRTPPESKESSPKSDD